MDVRVSLNLNDAIVKDQLIDIQDITQKLRTANPKDCKNLTFDALSFFLLIQLDERMLSSGDVIGLIKNSLSLCVRSASFNTSMSRSRYRYRYRTYNLMVISFPRNSNSRPFWSTTHIVRSIMLRAMIGK